MTRLVRNAALLTAGGMLVASIALANVPDPSKSTLGVGALNATEAGSIRLGGADGRVPAQLPTYVSPSGHAVGPVPAGARSSGYTIEVHDFANNPIAGSSVVVDFSSCVPGAGGDIRIASDQRNSLTGQTYVAPYKVAGSTNAAGRFTFYAIGAANSNTVTLAGNAVAPGINCAAAPTNCTNAGCARVYADGVLLSGTALRVTAWDINSLGSPADALTGVDAATYAAEIARGPVGGFRQRTDLDRNGLVAGPDAALISNVLVVSVGVPP